MASHLYIFYSRFQRCDAIKIGQSGNVKTRFKYLKTGNPFLLTLGTIDGLGNLEAKFHTALNAWHVGGEWFELCAASMRVLCNLIAGIGPVAQVEDWPGGRFVALVLEYTGQNYGDPSFMSTGGPQLQAFPGSEVGMPI